MTPSNIRALIHRLPAEKLRLLPASDLLDAHLLDNRSIVLLTRRIGVPDLEDDSQIWDGPVLDTQHVAKALVSVSSTTFSPSERNFLETFAIRACAGIDSTWAGASETTRDALREQLIFVFRIAARLGAPSSLVILRALIQHTIVDATLVPEVPPADPHQLVLTTLTRAANDLDLPALAAELGGASALTSAKTRAAVRAYADIAVLPDADATRVRTWMRNASRWSEYGAVHRVWNATRQRRVVPTGGAALGLLRYLVSQGHKGAARLLASDVVEGEFGLEVGFRSAFIALCAEEGFAQAARRAWERYFGDDAAAAQANAPAFRMDVDGAQVPRMSLRLVSLFLAIARSPAHAPHIPDAHEFALRVFAALPEEPRVEMHRIQVARAAFLLANQALTAEDATQLRQHALTMLRSTLDARRVPDQRAANVLLHELAQHDLSLAGQQLRHMRKQDVGPDGVALGSIAMKGVPRVLPRYGGTAIGGVGLLTSKGRRGVLRKLAELRKLDDDKVAQAVVKVGDPSLRRWWTARQRKASKPLESSS